MTIYTGILFVHAIAVLVLTASLTIEAWMLFQLRRASSPGEVRSWTAPVPGLTVASISSLVIVYVTGAYLTESLRAWEFAWPRFAVLEIILFAVLGALTGRRLRAIRRLCNNASEIESGWNAGLRSPLLKISLSIRIWIVIGTILLTAAKPEFVESLSIVVASVLLGWVSSLATLGRTRAISTARAGSR
ncbi:MAG TPA: hypothetical protein VMU57_10570 [Edaphobacter sp.]|uniref:hypothetical protein n=1 Tax=Edaphobacter sp. TaxID=1934404 RepID=UPI002CFC4F4D|nr:hypothetical protein [Edaphobacter sp.]HUZ95346.1 hypothetical protein [Edaphobacter sp.]